MTIAYEQGRVDRAVAVCDADGCPNRMRLYERGNVAISGQLSHGWTGTMDSERPCCFEHRDQAPTELNPPQALLRPSARDPPFCPVWATEAGRSRAHGLSATLASILWP